MRVLSLSRTLSVICYVYVCVYVYVYLYVYVYVYLWMIPAELDFVLTLYSFDTFIIQPVSPVRSTLSPNPFSQLHGLSPSRSRSHPPSQARRMAALRQDPQRESQGHPQRTRRLRLAKGIFSGHVIFTTHHFHPLLSRNNRSSNLYAPFTPPNSLVRTP